MTDSRVRFAQDVSETKLDLVATRKKTLASSMGERSQQTVRGRSVS